MKRLRFIPSVQDLASFNLTGAVVCVIDLLRATTTMTAALEFGCARILPYASLKSARSHAARLQSLGLPVWLAGERGGVAPPGFDAGNSPLEMSAVQGQTVVMTTTNGTRALWAVRGASRVFVVCLNNLSAAAHAVLESQPDSVLVLAAGEYGRPSPEDALAAGLFIRQLVRRQPSHSKPAWFLDGRAQQAYTEISRRSFSLRREVAATAHGRELIRYGFQKDIEYALHINSAKSVGSFTSLGIVRYQWK